MNETKIHSSFSSVSDDLPFSLKSYPPHITAQWVLLSQFTHQYTNLLTFCGLFVTLHVAFNVRLFKQVSEWWEGAYEETKTNERGM
jgi:hypothetical protein